MEDTKKYIKEGWINPPEFPKSKTFLGIKLVKYRIIERDGLYIAQIWYIYLPFWENLPVFSKDLILCLDRLKDHLSPQRKDKIIFQS
jgi:hypothetical protein